MQSRADIIRRYREKRKLMGGCTRCARVAMPDANMCEVCAPQVRAYNRSRYLRNRMGVKMGKNAVTEADRQRADRVLAAVDRKDRSALAVALAEIREEAILCSEVRAERVATRAAQHKGTGDGT